MAFNQTNILLICFITGYLIGSIPFGYIFTKLFTKKDLRKEGSHSTGFTNSLRVGGKLPAILTLIFDLTKPMLAAIVAWTIVNHISKGHLTVLYLAGKLQGIHLIVMVLTAVFAVIGHCFPVWLKFKGGKGVASTIGTVAIIHPYVALSGLAIWLIIFNIWHYVSLASIAMLISFPIFAYIFDVSFINTSVGILTFLAAFGTIMHIQNIKRLIKKNENKIYLFKKNKANNSEDTNK